MGFFFMFTSVHSVRGHWKILDFFIEFEKSKKIEILDKSKNFPDKYFPVKKDRKNLIILDI